MPRGSPPLSPYTTQRDNKRPSADTPSASTSQLDWALPYFRLCPFLFSGELAFTPIPVYYMPGNPDEARFARELHERIRREFPEVNRLAHTYTNEAERLVLAAHLQILG